MVKHQKNKVDTLLKVSFQETYDHFEFYDLKY